MKKKMFKTGMLGTVIATIVLAVLTIAAALLIYFIIDSALGHTNLVDADRYEDFGYLDAKYMSDSFASDDDGNKYVFVQTPSKRMGRFIISSSDFRNLFITVRKSSIKFMRLIKKMEVRHLSDLREP